MYLTIIHSDLLTFSPPFRIQVTNLSHAPYSYSS